MLDTIILDLLQLGRLFPKAGRQEVRYPLIARIMPVMTVIYIHPAIRSGATHSQQLLAHLEMSSHP